MEKQSYKSTDQKLVCLLTRCKAPQQSISDYKHGARAFVSAESEEQRKNRARGRRTAKEKEEGEVRRRE